MMQHIYPLKSFSRFSGAALVTFVLLAMMIVSVGMIGVGFLASVLGPWLLFNGIVLFKAGCCLFLAFRLGLLTGKSLIALHRRLLREYGWYQIAVPLTRGTGAYLGTSILHRLRSLLRILCKALAMLLIR